MYFLLFSVSQENIYENALDILFISHNIFPRQIENSIGENKNNRKELDISYDILKEYYYNNTEFSFR